jgi:hypothetical protein
MQHSKIRFRLKVQLSRFTSELTVGLSKPYETSSARCCSASHTPLSPHRFQRRTSPLSLADQRARPILAVKGLR